MTTSLRLRALTPQDEDAARRAHDVMAREGFEFLLGTGHDGDWSAYLRSIEDHRAGVGLPEGRVPDTFLVADVGGVIVGRVSVRHTLTPALAEFGGHIGYGVLPEHRRRGYATAMLRQALGVARSVGVRDALVTCDDDNVGSVRTIERCGGVLQDLVRDEGRTTRRYRVPTG